MPGFPRRWPLIKIVVAVSCARPEGIASIASTYLYDVRAGRGEDVAQNVTIVLICCVSGTVRGGSKNRKNVVDTTSFKYGPLQKSQNLSSAN